MKEFLSYVTDIQPIYFISIILLKDNIDGVCVPQFQSARIRDTTHSSHKNLVGFFREVHYMWW